MDELKRLFITVTFVAATTGYVRASETDDPNLLISNQVFQQLGARLSALEEQSEIQQRRIVELEKQNELQQNRISELEVRGLDQQKQNYLQQQRIAKLESRDLAHQELISDLEATIRDQEQHVKELNGSFTETYQACHNLRDELRANDEKIKVNRNEEQDEGSLTDSRMHARRQSEVTNVAFTVILAHRMDNMGLDQNVVFEKVETNIGNAYNTHHGVFIAPVAGTYVFHVTIYSHSGSTVEGWCKIVVNGVKKVDVYTYMRTLQSIVTTKVVKCLWSI